ncbi:GntR family transcriptional regulator [Macrococcoides caseolyticum]|uniref:GntR family transcriptional regulator n=1 Tax=Macrococcoides caseolyticum TaxID=69966 RepID=UPI001F25E118|nr:GntR family transcriptional regulator [Macrococcus caseolyticus]MCE4956972.1 GntR family transcriptional regulator [Macrococcus caseolyticus]
MYIEIDETSSTPVYLQLANQIIHHIAVGNVVPYDPLPSGRAFAKSLQINMHTVNKAYHYLEEKQLILVQPKSGAIIHPDALKIATDSEKEDLLNRLKPIIDEAKCKQLSVNDLLKLLEGEG